MLSQFVPTQPVLVNLIDTTQLANLYGVADLSEFEGSQFGLMNLLDKMYDVEELEQDTVIEARKFDILYFKNANIADQYEFVVRGAPRVLHTEGSDLGVQPVDNDGKPIYLHIIRKKDRRQKNVIIVSKAHWFDFFHGNNYATPELMNLKLSWMDPLERVVDIDYLPDDAVLKCKADHIIWFKNGAERANQYERQVFGAARTIRERGNDYGVQALSIDKSNIYVHFTRKSDGKKKNFIIQYQA